MSTTWEPPKAFQCERCGVVYFQRSSSCICGAVVLKTPREVFQETAKLLQAAYHCLRSYQYGNSATEPAERLADLIASRRVALGGLGTREVSPAEKDL